MSHGDNSEQVDYWSFVEFQNILNKKGVRANLDIFAASSTMSRRGEKHSVCHVGDTKMRIGPRPFVEDSVSGPSL